MSTTEGFTATLISRQRRLVRLLYGRRPPRTLMVSGFTTTLIWSLGQSWLPLSTLVLDESTITVDSSSQRRPVGLAEPAKRPEESVCLSVCLCLSTVRHALSLAFMSFAVLCEEEIKRLVLMSFADKGVRGGKKERKKERKKQNLLLTIDRFFLTPSQP